MLKFLRAKLEFYHLIKMECQGSDILSHQKQLKDLEKYMKQ